MRGTEREKVEPAVTEYNLICLNMIIHNVKLTSFGSSGTKTPAACKGA